MMRAIWLNTSIIVLAAACNPSEAPPAAPAAHHVASPAPAVSPPEPTAKPAALTKVDDASAVCMVNNTYMGQPQIPVQVEGRTYFGCCEMCRGRLERDPSSRLAIDPVSGRQVDKAAAVIGKDAANRVFYFENESTYGRYTGT